MNGYDLVLAAVRPLTPGAAPRLGVSLDAIDLHPTRLAFHVAAGATFVVRLRRRQAEGPIFARAGAVDLVLEGASDTTRDIEQYVRALAEQVRRNVASMASDDVDALTSTEPPLPAALRRRAQIGGSKLLDINVGDGCNLACTFCTDVDSRGRDLFRPAAFWMDELARAREGGKEGLLISGNEPTLRPDLPAIVDAARRLGFIEIELSTAGVRLADRAYLAELLGAGVNVLAVSIHGSNADVDGRQTGRPDFFEPRRRGLEHFVDIVGGREAQEKAGVFLKTITIFTQDNVADLPALVGLLDRHQVSYMLLHYPWIKGGAAHGFDRVVPSYPAVVAALEPLRQRIEPAGSSLAVANLPPCVAPHLRADRTPRKDIVRPAAEQDSPRALRLVSTMDPTMTFAPCCDGCDARPRCDGVPRAYVETFGSLGLRPL